MKNILTILLFLFSHLAFAQYNPIPTENGTRFFYRSPDNNLSSIAVAGTFNNWNEKEFYMEYSIEDSVWFVDVPLKHGKEFLYKFILNDTLWITDPNAPNLTNDKWKNGIIIPQDYGIPFVKKIEPGNNDLIKSLLEIKIYLSGYNSKIDESSIKLFFNNSSVIHDYDNTGSLVTFKLPEDIKDGEHELLIKFADKNGNINKGYESRFYLDRFINQIETPGFYDSAVLYEIFIRTFHDSDNDGTGDFKGMVEKIDYLKNYLGIDAIWTMPWKKSSAVHGYNVTDYFDVENDYGDFSEYLEFIKASKKNGIKVIMDFVINHSDSAHPYFLDSYNNPESKYSDWYLFTDSTNTDWEHFGIDRTQPKLNLENPDVKQYVFKAAEFWLDPNGDGDRSDGVDGFRLDAAKYVTHKFWKLFYEHIKSIDKNILLLAEVWDNANFMIPFFKEEFDMCFAYPFYYSLQEFVNQNDISGIINALKEESELYPAGYQMIRFASNHDIDRALSMTGENIDLYKQITFIIFTLPGTPMIYYGDELGFTGKIPPENVRQKMDWKEVESQMKSESSFLSFNKKMVSLRKTNSVLSLRNDSKFKSLLFPEAENSDGLLSYIRYDEDSLYLILVNNSGKTKKDFTFNNSRFNFSGFKEVNVVLSDKFLFNENSLIISNESIFLSEINLDNGGFALIKFSKNK